nr:type II toxin-antitoxin system VapC family toxin [Pseudonocardia sp.]
MHLDTSAFLKLVRDEAESPALRGLIGERGDLVSSALLVVEARRGVLRRDPRKLPEVDVALDRVDVLEMSGALLESASRLPDPLLRSHDAIHLATALLIRDDVDVLLTYDDRLAEAARTHGVPTASPA